MAQTKIRTAEYRGALLAALLRLSRQEIVLHVERGLRALGAQPLHETISQPLHEHPAGLRITHLAQMAGVTKQSIAEMVNTMEAAGYIERVPDPGDGRARLVRLTRRGRTVNERTRELVREAEACWAERIGADRVEALRATLQAIVASQKSAPGDPDSSSS